MAGCGNDSCSPPLLSRLCNTDACYRPNAACSTTGCCSPCLQPCGYPTPPRPLPATACVTVCSVCRPPICPQPCKLCPLVRCSKMLFVAPPHRRGYARYSPPPSALPRSCGGGSCLRMLPPWSVGSMPPMKFSLNSCCHPKNRPFGITPRICSYK